MSSPERIGVQNPSILHEQVRDLVLGYDAEITFQRHQLADDESCRFPQAAKILKKSAYVDDLLFGANDISSAMLLHSQLNDLMHSGG